MGNKEIKITAIDGGQFNAYMAAPEAGSGPCVVVIQEVFGVNAWLRRVADRISRSGYLAIVPDLFWRQEPDVQLDSRNPADRDKAMVLYSGFDQDKGVDDLIATVDQARKMPGCTGKVGTVGYCLGGKLAYLIATRSGSDANVSYYGVGVENHLGESPKIGKPLMLHIAGQDKWSPPEVVAQIESALGGNPLVTLHLYPEADHAFAREGGDHYDPESAELANRRSREFFERHLKS